MILKWLFYTHPFSNLTKSALGESIGKVTNILHEPRSNGGGKGRRPMMPINHFHMQSAKRKQNNKENGYVSYRKKLAELKHLIQRRKETDSLWYLCLSIAYSCLPITCCVCRLRVGACRLREAHLVFIRELRDEWFVSNFGATIGSICISSVL
jgi:hypothetical protein